MRFGLIVPLVKAIVTGSWVWAFALFTLAIVTDVLDGYLARLWKQETHLGACLDPLADKALVLSSYGAFVYAASESGIPEWFLYLVCVKEAVLLAGAFIFGIIQGAIAIRPSIWGKSAMVAQSLLITTVLCSSFCSFIPDFCIEFLFWAATLLVIWSLISYGRQLIGALIWGIQYGC